MRRDKGPTCSSSMFRVYLDNFDEIRKVDTRLASLVEGKPSDYNLAVRAAYEKWKLPRHPKKAVESALIAEVQGAVVDGKKGKAWPKPSKVGVYVVLALELLRRGAATLRELQVVAGGFVYFSMFRRPLLCSLNAIWQHMEKMKHEPPVVRLPIPSLVQLELARFCTLVPLARMDFRLGVSGMVTASDASNTGGGLCSSCGLTSFGRMASRASVRGDVPEEHDFVQVLGIGLFDGIGALRVACDTLNLPMGGYVSVEKSPEGRRVVESHFPDTVFIEHVEDITEEVVRSWACQFSTVGLVIIGAGPPCQGVSGLNADKRGALRDARSCLFAYVPVIKAWVKKFFPWAQVRSLMESVASMSHEDCSIMSEAIQLQAWKLDAADISVAHRPRLYWIDWEIVEQPGVRLAPPESDSWGSVGVIRLEVEINPAHYLEPGGIVNNSSSKLPTFTTSRPSNVPGRKPAGVHLCTPEDLNRWHQDRHRFPPYQYRNCHCIRTSQGLRLATVREREVILGFPLDYTASCAPKHAQKGLEYEDARLTLLGNSWSVTGVCWLLHSLCSTLGLCRTMTLAEVVALTKPGSGSSLQHILLRPPLPHRTVPGTGDEVTLVHKLGGLVSVKGEDLLLQNPTEHLVKFHRLRASVPGKLWKWKTVCGWQWATHNDHINVLEMRAIFTGIKWRVLKGRAHQQRFLHLTDSLVCLHALSRGRTSSRKLRRTLVRLNSYLLAANLAPIWGYIHTSQNPADRPSRRGVRRKWK